MEIQINSLAFQGFGVGKDEGKVYFVKMALPGDLVTVKINKRKKNYCEGEIENIISNSPNRIEPRCKYFGVCGGCSLQNLDYEQQIFWKRQHIIDCFERIGKIFDVNYFETMASPKIFNYRNKMEFSFSNSRWLTKEEIDNSEIINDRNFALGLHIPGRFDKVLDVTECHIQSELGNSILQLFHEKAREFGVSAFSEREHTGFLRNLIIRSTIYNQETMLILLTNRIKEQKEVDFLDWFKNNCRNEIAGITSLIQAVNSTVSPVAQGEIYFVQGNEYIYEEILGVKYRISPFSFFQTNSFQLNPFISKIIEFANISKNDVVWDLYCGTGSISLPAASLAKEVVGMELVQSSIDDAKLNASINNIDNVKFKATDLHSKNIFEILSEVKSPDIIIIDPPRAGMHNNLINHILQLNAKRIVYVSCNPSTQARDCDYLKEKYTVKQIQPVDMFPHTFHVESIALLERNEN